MCRLEWEVSRRGEGRMEGGREKKSEHVNPIKDNVPFTNMQCFRLLFCVGTL